MSSNAHIIKSFQSGDTIMRQGEPGDCAYIIEKGRVDIIVKRPDGKEQSVGTRGPGTIIGEMSLVDKAPRTATVKAIEDCEFLVITQDEFERRLKGADPILHMTTQVILARYRDTLLRSELTGENRTWPPTEAIEINYSKSSDAVEKVKLANELKEAFDNGDLHLHYQPIVNLTTGQTCGFEALMRWNHPERGAISPGIFIPSAEETGLINDASQWALREACATLKRIEQHTGLKDLFVSVNFSGTDFAVDGFAQTVYNTVSETDIEASQLHIELTERILMAQPDVAKKTLEMCSEAGMHISIDDFGTGYSSLSYLQHFPINTLKIDRSFVTGIDESEDSFALAKSIVDLGKNMKMDIIAEGAETRAEVDTLKSLNCDMVQGFFFAKPMTESDVINFVNGKMPKASNS